MEMFQSNIFFVRIKEYMTSIRCYFQYGKQIGELLDMPTYVYTFLGIQLLNMRIDPFWLDLFDCGSLDSA